jgi:hypothetical protein
LRRHREDVLLASLIADGSGAESQNAASAVHSAQAVRAAGTDVLIGESKLSRFRV